MKIWIIKKTQRTIPGRPQGFNGAAFNKSAGMLLFSHRARRMTNNTKFIGGNNKLRIAMVPEFDFEMT
jgi:hypothetical protein